MSNFNCDVKIIASSCPGVKIVSGSGPEVDVIVGVGPQGPVGPVGPVGPGVPTGGNNGQILTKASDDDYDTEWTTVSGTGSVTNVSVANANGITGVVANPTTTPQITLSIDANSIANDKLSQMPASTIKGNVSGSTANVSDLSGTQTTSLLDVFTSSLKGLAPSSGGGTVNYLRADGIWSSPPGATSGTVTSVSVSTANGVSGTVADPTTTPSISLTLGAITPTSVASVGAVTGSNLSGTNTGDQTITLTGDVTGTGMGSFAATIANKAVTYAKIQDVSATDKLLGRSTAGSGTVEEITCTQAGRNILDDVDASAQRTTLGLGTAAVLDSSTDINLSPNSDSLLPTQKAVKTYVDAAVTGLWDFKGSIDCSTNPNYPAASKGDAYVVSVAGKIGGASGVNVDVGDVIVAIADNAGGTQASVGSSWIILEHNLQGALLAANNLSDVASVSAAVTNLGLTIGTNTQAFSSLLTNLAALATNGILVKTAAGTTATRTIDGTTDRISVTNGDGVSGNPTADIASTYAGQTSITTLGTIVTGVWNGTTIAIADGGTGATSAAGAKSNLGLATVASTGSHNDLTDLTTGDPHTQYFFLAGRSGGQSLIGGTASGNNLTLSSTSNATKGKVIFGSTTAYDEVNDRFGVGTASPSAKLHVVSTTEQQRLAYDVSNYMTTTVSSVGVVTFDAVGSGSTSFAFSDRTYVGLPSSTNDFKVGTSSSWTQTTGSYAAFAAQINAAPTASSTAIMYGTHMEVGVASANSQNMTAAQALIGFRLGCQHRGTGTVTGYVGIICNTPGFSSSGAITNSYALYIAPQVTSGVTNGYGIYQTGASDRNYFAGSIAVGFTTAPTAKVQIRHTSEQQRIEYDASNYYSTTVSSTGVVNFDCVGSGAGFTFSDSITLADAKDIVVNTSTGTKIGTSISQKLGFYNATPIAQRASAAQAAVVTTASTNVAPFGFTTSAQADSIVTLVNELRDWAVAQGFIKGAA